jgi:hypothetical protein
MERRTTVTGLAGLLGALAAAGCGITVRPPPGGGSSGGSAGGDKLRIDLDAGYAEVRAGRGVLVDVRSADSFRARRAAGAVSLPLDDIEKAPAAALAALPAGKRPILYCT